MPKEKRTQSRKALAGVEKYPTMIDEHGLSVLPISSLGLDYEVSSERMPTGIDRLDAMLTRLIDFLKNQGVTTLFTSLTEGGQTAEQSEVGVSSLMDTWLLLRHVETGAERNRLLFVLKSRGMAHSNQVREFVLTDNGIQLRDVYSGPGIVLTGSARLVQEAKDRAQSATERESITRRRRELEQEHALAQAQLQALQLKTAALGEELQTLEREQETRSTATTREQTELARARGVETGEDLAKKGSKAHAQ
jgi:circadian clock protein KaiC